MRNKFLLIVVFCSSICYYASSQETQKSGKISSSYDRNSLSTFYLKFDNDNRSSKVEQSIGNIAFSEKFDNNNLNRIVLDAPTNRFQMGDNASSAILTYLNNQNIGLQIISKWFNRQVDGKMDMELIFNRGMFNATDASYIKAQTTKRGNSLLKDYGERLIQRSYILVLDYTEIKTAKEANIENSHGWCSKVNAYLYKVNFTEETRDKIYDCWIYEEDTQEEIDRKNLQFNSINVSLTFVTKAKINASGIQPNPNTTYGRLIEQKSDDELFIEMIQKGYGESIYSFEREVDDFMVKTTIASTRPLRAKIGKKEGLTCDSRYFAYEYVYNEKSNSAVPVRRGVIRATSKIVDNRHIAKGDMGTSKFYQTAGRRLDAGYLLRQQNDYGIEIMASMETGQLGGFNARLDYRAGKAINIQSFFIYIDMTLGTGNYYGGKHGHLDATFFRYGAGLAKGLQLARNIELRPFIGIGVEKATGDDIRSILQSSSDKNNYISVLYFRAGANLALNLTHYLQLTAGVSVYPFIGEASDDNEILYGKWDEIFPERKGTASMVGLKLMF